MLTLSSLVTVCIPTRLAVSCRRPSELSLCGTTHMVLATTHGRFGEAFRWNPLMFGVCVGGLAMLILRVGFRRRVVWITSAQSRRVVTMALLLAVLANWLYLLAVT